MTSSDFRRQSLLVALCCGMLAILLGCHSVPQAGTYEGSPGKLGTPVLKVRSDGRVTKQYGPVIWSGRWTPITQDSIKADLTLAGEMRVEYFKLDKSTRKYDWDLSLESLQSHRPAR